MIKSYRSKRRKIQEDISILNNPNLNSFLQINDPQSSNQAQNISTNQLISQSSNCNKNRFTSLDTEINCNNNLDIQNVSLEVNRTTSNLSDIQLNSLCNNDNNVSNIKYQNTLKNKIANWVLECNVPHTTVNKLLHILKNEEYLPLRELPKDSRTLLNTNSTKTSNIITMKPGIYYHFGLECGITRNLSKYNLDNEIKVVVGVDGLPLSKSSSSQYWPILAYIYPHSDKVFPIGIYHGNEKPYDSNDFLKYFIDEFKYLMMNGIKIYDVTKKVLLYAFCCDAPAKSFVLKVKGHSGFSSCTRCFQKGEY